jgi:hypothetical protein
VRGYHYVSKPCNSTFQKLEHHHKQEHEYQLYNAKYASTAQEHYDASKDHLLLYDPNPHKQQGNKQLEQHYQ